jgi:hypothetical protein
MIDKKYHARMEEISAKLNSAWTDRARDEMRLQGIILELGNLIFEMTVPTPEEVRAERARKGDS